MNTVGNLCWICGDEATTCEHFIKKTDVIDVFGAKFTQDQRVIKTDFDKHSQKFIIQSPDSKHLKYSYNLCAKCNNERTQPYDKAYAEFARYIKDNASQLRRHLEINTKLIFGKSNAKKQRKNLFCYFMKAFGCQLNEHNIPIPQDIKDGLTGKNYGNIFRVSICISEAFEQYIHNFPLEGSRTDEGYFEDYFWAQHNGWFTIVYAYNRPISKEFGDEWRGTSKKFLIGKWKHV
jgi:hypothetical protein